MTKTLILDADRDLRALLGSALAASGAEVLEAGSTREAEEQLSRGPVDLAVVDGNLLNGAGLDFIARLRQRDRTIRLVLLSAHFRDLKTFTQLTTELDVSLVMYKPIEPIGFAQRITQLLSPLPAPAAPAKAAEPSATSALALDLGALRTQFASRLPDKLAALTVALEAARLDPGRLDDARTLAHRLRGSAGSYGYAAVGAAVGLVEDLLKADDPSKVAARRFFWEDVEGALRDARAAAARAPDLASRGIEVPHPRQRALLVVDDDPEFLQMVRGIARKLLIEVVTAQSPDEALQCAQSQPLVAALLDVHLGDQTSFSLARRLRETPANAQLPIAFASVDRSIQTRVAIAEAGGTKFFEKPMTEESFSELAQQLMRVADGQQARVLSVDDDQDAIDEYSTHLRAAGFAVDHLLSADGLVEQLERTRPDVLLLDVNLPRVSGIDVCRALRLSERWELLPILIVTTQTDAATRLRAFRAGASDVIAKPVLPEELLARVRVQEERARLLSDRADKDGLSGLLLRRAFVEAFQRSLAACTRDKKPLSLVLLDFDHFKQINDTHGHLAGDRVIARLGELLRRRFRVEDLRARWGGEEFVLVFPGCGVDFATRAARLLLEEFSALSFTGDDTTPFCATFTAGAVCCPDDGVSMSALIRRADELLYAGKRAGRNRVMGGSVADAGAAAAQARSREAQ